MTKPKLIIINGLPASGKSRLAARLSSDLHVPVFAKDDFKELLADTIGYTDYESTRNFGKASFSLLFLMTKKCLEKGVSVIIEGNFSVGEETLNFLEYLAHSSTEVFEIICYAETALIVERFLERMKTPERHPVHHIAGKNELNAWIERVLKGGKKVAPLTANFIEVDTTDPAEIDYKKILMDLSV